MRVVIIGAGGHGQVTAEILLRMQEQDGSVQPLGYLDDDPKLAGQGFLGLPVLGAMADWSEIEHDAAIVAIGDNAVRRRRFQELESQGEHWAIACHPRAVVGLGVRIGRGSVICAGAVINAGSVIGANVILNTGCTVDHHNRIGDHVHVAPGAHLGGEVTIGEGTLVGIGAIVMPGRSVGDWSIVGAGALVHRHLPSHITAIGVPARVMQKGWQPPARHR
jgi:sugar O-acyltransferase (sialic acid O-acetyltransferase NeuD family)